MIVNIAVAVGAVLAVAVTFVVAAPARATARGPRHRERDLHRNPARATSADVRQLLDHELPSHVTQAVCQLAEEREVPPSMLWSWADCHSASLLALALSAGFGRRELAATRPSAIELDQESLEMSAELNGSLIGSLVVQAVHPSASVDHHHDRRQRRTPHRAA